MQEFITRNITKKVEINIQKIKEILKEKIIEKYNKNKKKYII